MEVIAAKCIARSVGIHRYPFVPSLFNMSVSPFPLFPSVKAIQGLINPHDSGPLFFSSMYSFGVLSEAFVYSNEIGE